MKLLLIIISIYSLLLANVTYGVTDDELRKIIFSAPVFHGLTNEAQDKKYDEWTAKIREMPSITPRVIELLHEENDEDKINYYFRALNARGDLQKEALNDLIAAVITIAEAKNEPTFRECSFAFGVISLLKKKPSSEHEMLLLKYFHVHDGAFRHSIIDALGSIGTSASILTLNEFIKSRTTIHGPDGHAQITKIVVEKIEQREQRKNRGDARKTPNSDITTPNQQVTNDVSLKDETEATPTQSKFIVLAIALVLIFLGYKFLARSSRSS